MNISAIIIAKDEAEVIRRCLASVAFADEKIVVVDAATKDATAKIAAKSGAAVVSRAWSSYGDQKNFGRSLAHGDWLLYVDADEVIPPELAREIKSVIAKPEADFYWLRVVTHFLEKPLKHLYGHNLRLFRKDAGKWTDDKVHEQVATLQGERVNLGHARSRIMKAPLEHHSHRTLASYLSTMHTYTSLDAAQMTHTGAHRSGRAVKPTPWLPWHLALRQFIKLYVYRRGFLDGYAGFLWSALSARYEWEMAKKYLAHLNQK